MAKDEGEDLSSAIMKAMKSLKALMKTVKSLTELHHPIKLL